MLKEAHYLLTCYDVENVDSSFCLEGVSYDEFEVVESLKTPH